MHLSRKTTNLIRYFMDEWLPPALRDSPFFTRPLVRLFAGKQADLIRRFKDRSVRASDEEFESLLSEIIAAHEGKETMGRETDLNRQCIERILLDSRGESVLDAGCGVGYLTAKLAEKFPRVVGLDRRADIGGNGVGRAEYRAGNVESLPFADDSFDTVVCSHTIEHVRDVRKTAANLRRVARRRLIIVTPKQRPYRVTFDTHLHFFPYPHSFLLAIGGGKGEFTLEVLGGDLYYIETYE